MKHEYQEEQHPMRCVTCGGRFTRIFTAPPRDKAEAKRRAYGLKHNQQCPFCSRFRPVAS